jgi:hypothetical protein
MIKSHLRYIAFIIVLSLPLLVTVNVFASSEFPMNTYLISGKTTPTPKSQLNKTITQTIVVKHTQTANTRLPEIMVILIFIIFIIILIGLLLNRMMLE